MCDPKTKNRNKKLTSQKQTLKLHTLKLLCHLLLSYPSLSLKHTLCTGPRLWVHSLSGPAVVSEEACRLPAYISASSNCASAPATEKHPSSEGFISSVKRGLKISVSSLLSHPVVMGVIPVVWMRLQLPRGPWNSLQARKRLCVCKVGQIVT